MSDGQWGGYRKPSNPAAASGPGSLSARTDGGATDMRQLGNQAPMSTSGPEAPSPMAAPSGVPSRDSLPGLMDPTNRPDEPVTAGASLGAGVGPVGAGLLPAVSIDKKEVATIVARLDSLANLPSTTAETRAWVRTLKNRLGTPN